MSFIKLGMIGTFDSKTFQVVGRLRYRATYKEWDKEDRRYTSGHWTYDEWILVNESKEYLYLEEDKEGYSLYKEVKPDLPKIPKNIRDDMRFFKKHYRSKTLEMGRSTVTFVEGESSWKAKVNDRSNYAEYKQGRTTFTTEWSFKSDGKTINEVEFFRSEKVYAVDLYRAFGMKKELVREEKKIKQMKEHKMMSIGFLILAFFLFVTPFGGGPSEKALIFEAGLDDFEVLEDGLVVGPFDLNEVGELHRIEMRGEVQSNSYSWFGMELLNSDLEAINVLEGDFWHETGVDSDGSWEESSLSSRLDFKLKNEGEYSMRIFHEEGTSPSAAMQIRVYEKVAVIWPFMLAAFFSIMIFGLITLSVSTYESHRK